MLEWNRRITKEFFSQGDLEREAGLKINPIMDRNVADVPKSTKYFAEILVKPLFETILVFGRSSCDNALKNGKLNQKRFWTIFFQKIYLLNINQKYCPR